MSHLLRIGLISEGEAELGTSVPFIYDPKEGALHTLIRRELTESGISDCVFVHRHRTSKDNTWRLRMGSSVIESKYLAKAIIAWKPHEVDLIIVVIDEDNLPDQRAREISKAKQVIAECHVDINGNRIKEDIFNKL